mmetsp:Transcript_17808/g.21778  ORF Transcript_17808/g.21778 Transcript_17808/m.21778 type:complete len:516 (+) Transcript_17808:710-2257(+)
MNTSMSYLPENQVQVVQCNPNHMPTRSSYFSVLSHHSSSAASPASSTTNSTDNQSKENLQGYFTRLRDHRGDDFDQGDDSSQSSHFTRGSGGGLGGMTRSKTRVIFSTTEKFQSHPDLQSLCDQQEQEQYLEEEAKQPYGPLESTIFFAKDINDWTNGSPEEPVFDKDLRNFIEPHIAKARLARDEKRHELLQKIGVESRPGPSIGSNAYVPYPSLRHERRFLYDVETYPLHQILAETLGVSDLSLIHQHHIQDKKTLMKPLLDGKKRQGFHRCYDNFVTSFCIPLLHSLAIGDNLFNDSRRNNGQQKIFYRYQAFPCIRVNRPGEFSIGPHCDMSYGHSMGNINFHIPLTPTFGTNALYAESHPGREDWHPLKTKSIGLGYSFDGSRNLHFTLKNSTQRTRVSLDFRIAIHRDSTAYIHPIPTSINKTNAKMMMEHSIFLREAMQEDDNDYDVHDMLCNRKVLQDTYSSFPGYYEEAYIDLGHSYPTTTGADPVVMKRSGSALIEPDSRVGFPF